MVRNLLEKYKMGPVLADEGGQAAEVWPLGDVEGEEGEEGGRGLTGILIMRSHLGCQHQRCVGREGWEGQTWRLCSCRRHHRHGVSGWR